MSPDFPTAREVREAAGYHDDRPFEHRGHGRYGREVKAILVAEAADIRLLRRPNLRGPEFAFTHSREVHYRGDGTREFVRDSIFHGLSHILCGHPIGAHAFHSYSGIDAMTRNPYEVQARVFAQDLAIPFGWYLFLRMNDCDDRCSIDYLWQRFGVTRRSMLDWLGRHDPPALSELRRPGRRPDVPKIGRCEACGFNTCLDAHHNTYRRLGREWASDIRLLCRRCHDLHHVPREQLTFSEVEA